MTWAPSLLIAVVTAVVTVWLSFRRFHAERWWERKADAYSAIVNALNSLVTYSSAMLEAERGVTYTPERQKALKDDCNLAYRELEKATGAGAYIVSDVAAAILAKLETRPRVDPESNAWFEVYSADRDAYKAALEEIRAAAKRDLGVSTGLARKFAVAALIGALLVTAALAAYRWREAHVWPFSTGTSDTAFLGVTFGMSPQEARRALSEIGGQLVSYDEYRRFESPSKPVFGFPDSFIPLFADDRGNEARWYIPPVEMFSSAATAELIFRDDMFKSLEVSFEPVETNRARDTVAAIEGALKSLGDLVGREESQEVKGAYTLRFAHSSCTRSLWVNLTDEHAPIVRLSVWRSTTQEDRKRSVRAREEKAFGSK